MANQSDNTVSVLTQQADGTFSTSATYPAPTVPTSVALGDVNGDGLLDLAVSVYNSSAALLRLGQPGGTFGAATSYSMSTIPQSVLLADVSGDGALDLLTGSDSELTLRIQQANGTFGPRVDFPSLEGWPEIVDLDGDGKLDLAVLRGRLTIARNLGAGTFGPELTYSGGGVGNTVVVPRTANDFTGDGRMDLLVLHDGPDEIVLLENVCLP